MRNWEIRLREKMLRGSILAGAPSLAALIPLAVLDRWWPLHALVIALIAVASPTVSFALLFYAIWLIGYSQGQSWGHHQPELLGDDNLYPPKPYWPWSRRAAAIRRRRRIREIERECGVPEYPLG